MSEKSAAETVLAIAPRLLVLLPVFTELLAEDTEVLGTTLVLVIPVLEFPCLPDESGVLINADTGAAKREATSSKEEVTTFLEAINVESGEDDTGIA
jgi:hypothetical protein